MRYKHILHNYKGCIKIYERKQIGSGIWFSKVTDHRFKVNRIAVLIYTDINDSSLSRSDYAVVPYILVDSCEKYPDYSALSLRFSELYGATLSDNTSFDGDSRCSSLTVTSIDDRFALEGESVEQESCELLLECLLHPLTEEGVFSERTTKLMQAELLDSIDSVINDKRSYASHRGAELAYEGEPWQYSIQGTRPEAEKITAQSAYEAYRKMLKNGRIEIMAVGCSDFLKTEETLTQAFLQLERGDIFEPSVTPSILKSELCSFTETMSMQQAIVRMYFKAPDMGDRYAGALLSTILGGMTTSRFFMNIREKQSLCYYCSCFSNRFKRTITAYAGVEAQNVQKTVDAVLAEFKDVCENGVSEDELARAKLEIINNAKSVYDSVHAIASWYVSQLMDERVLTIEEYIAEVEKVTPERIQAACKQYKPDTLYILTPEVENDA